jgi:peroxiredoxin
MSNRRWLFRVLVISAIAVLVALPGCDPPPPPGKEVGNLAPDITGVDVDGKPVRLSDYRGKVVLVNFWGTWCPPCRAMIPHEREMVEHKYKDRPFVMLGVASDSAETLREFFKENPLPWPSIVDGNRIVSREWGVRNFPTLVLIDHKGVIRDRWEGGGAANDVWMAVEKAVTAAGAQ